MQKQRLTFFPEMWRYSGNTGKTRQLNSFQNTEINRNQRRLKKGGGGRRKFSRKLWDSGYFCLLTRSALHEHREKDQGPGKAAAGLEEMFWEWQKEDDREARRV